MKLYLNGRQIDVGSDRLDRVLADSGIDLDASGVAVAVNDQVVPKTAWSDRRLREDDRLEVITAMQGG